MLVSRRAEELPPLEADLVSVPFFLLSGLWLLTDGTGTLLWNVALPEATDTVGMSVHYWNGLLAGEAPLKPG